jgi:hypothetical protein
MNKAVLVAGVAAAAMLGMAPGGWAQARRGAGNAEAASTQVRQEGLLPVIVDTAKGAVMLSLPAPGADGVLGRYLYLPSLRTGLGSAPIGLDKAAAGESRILVLRQVGAKVVAEYENPKFRAANAPAAEQAAARDSFAYSTVWAGSFTREAGGRLLVDISGFLTRDVMGIADQLKQGGEPGFKLSDNLTVVDTAATKVFPENLEFEVRQTFAADAPGAEARNIAPDPKLITLAVHHSLIKLPEPGYEPRWFDPRSGAFSTVVNDYAAPLGEPIVRRLAPRFRLEKVDPAAARSPVKKPIVFYIDRAAPEPVRTALAEGVAWWAAAFDAAGFVDAFRVEILPEGADPLDVRYNVVNWTNRATRGWSYGQAITDPRTGEIIKGSVLLGSLRVRQDMLIFEALLGADKVGAGGPQDPINLSLARMRQLGAHEVGHALGFAHNFAASTQGRASVMDYPAPRIGLKDGRVDLSDAYGAGVGAWDRYIVDWLYGDAASAPAKAQAARELRYVTDVDARTIAGAQPWGGLWDDGPDPAAELSRMLAVRRAAIANFGLQAIRPGESVADLRRKFVPVYLLHRYQVDAAVKLVGGVDFAYSVRGDGREAAPPVAAAQQRAALGALLDTLDPHALDVPERLLPLLSAGQSGDSDRQFEIEVFRTAGTTVFDPLVAAETAAAMTYNALLEPNRLNRLIDQHRRDAAMLGVGEVIDGLTGRVFPATAGPQRDPRLAAVLRAEQSRLVLALHAARADPALNSTAAAVVDQRLAALAARLARSAGSGEDASHDRWLAALVGDRERLDALAAQDRRKPAVPPGMPIGESDWFGDLP